jgi:serine/threonine protein kinase
MTCYTKEIRLEEYEMITKINEIDCENNYHLPLIENKKNKSWSGECMFVNFKHGGNDLSKLDYSKINGHLFLKNLETIFYGMKDMNEKKFYHMDLKPDNILFDGKTMKMNIIDFGMSIFNLDVSSKQKEDFIEICNANTYILWPFEVILFQTSQIDLEKKLIKYLELGNYFAWYSTWTKNKSWALKIRKNLKNVQKTDIIQKIDVYTLGLTLFFILYRFNEADITLDVEFENQLLLLATKMTDPTTCERISSTEAYKEYRVILKEFNII